MTGKQIKEKVVLMFKELERESQADDQMIEAILALLHSVREEVMEELHKNNNRHWWKIIDKDLSEKPFDVCVKCGVVRRFDKSENPCNGWVKVKLRSKKEGK